MQAIRFVVPDGLERATRDRPADVVVRDEQTPTLQPGEVLIKVEAAGINQADIHQRAGNYPPPPGASEIPGLEVAGTVADVGEGVDRSRLGSRVCALLAGGGYAEYVAVDERQVIRTPEGLTSTQAAGIVEVAATAWANTVMHANMSRGDVLLVHGGTGGVGQFAIQLALALGVRAIATSGTEEKVALVRELGADGIDYSREDFAARVLELTEGRGADVILDTVGGRYLNENVRALAMGGRLVIIGTQGGGRGELRILPLMQKRAWVTGTTLRARTPAEKGEVLQQVEEHIWPLIESEKMRIDEPETFRLAETEAALTRFAAADRTGKIVLTVS